MGWDILKYANSVDSLRNVSLPVNAMRCDASYEGVCGTSVPGLILIMIRVG
jgi:hypothetical protein